MTVRDVLGIPKELWAWYPPGWKRKKTAGRRLEPACDSWAEARAAELSARGVRATVLTPRGQSPVVYYRLPAGVTLP